MASEAVVRAGRPRSERARTAILATTLELLEQQGLDGLTIEGIAAKAGVGKATIYRWWPSRVALVLEAIEGLPELKAPDTGSFTEDLRTLLSELTDLLLSTPLGNVLAHLGSRSSSGDPEVRDYMQRRQAGAIEMFKRAIQRGELPADAAPDMLTYLTIGPVINRAFYGPPPDDDYIDLVVRTMIAGYPTALQQRSDGSTPTSTLNRR